LKGGLFGKPAPEPAPKPTRQVESIDDYSSKIFKFSSPGKSPNPQPSKKASEPAGPRQATIHSGDFLKFANFNPEVESKAAAEKPILSKAERLAAEKLAKAKKAEAKIESFFEMNEDKILQASILEAKNERQLAETLSSFLNRNKNGNKTVIVAIINTLPLLNQNFIPAIIGQLIHKNIFKDASLDSITYLVNKLTKKVSASEGERFILALAGTGIDCRSFDLQPLLVHFADRARSVYSSEAKINIRALGIEVLTLFDKLQKISQSGSGLNITPLSGFSPSVKQDIDERIADDNNIDLFTPNQEPSAEEDQNELLPSNILNTILRNSTNDSYSKQQAWKLVLMCFETYSKINFQCMPSLPKEIYLRENLIENMCLLHNSIYDHYSKRIFIDLSSVDQVLSVANAGRSFQRGRIIKTLMYTIQKAKPFYSNDKESPSYYFKYALAESDLKTIVESVIKNPKSKFVPVYLQLVATAAVEINNLNALAPLMKFGLQNRLNSSARVIGFLEFAIAKQALMQHPFEKVRAKIEKIMQKNLSKFDTRIKALPKPKAKEGEAEKSKKTVGRKAKFELKSKIPKQVEDMTVLVSERKEAVLAMLLDRNRADMYHHKLPFQYQFFKRYIFPVLSLGISKGSVPAFVGYLGEATRTQMLPLVKLLIEQQYNRLTPRHQRLISKPQLKK